MGLPLIRSAVVVGTSAGAGQTLVATALVRALCGQGVRAVGMQAFARGVAVSGRVMPGDELQRLAAAGALDLPARVLVPALLPPEADARAPDLDEVVERFRMLATWADAVILDAGDGTREKIALGFDPLRLARALQLPVVLVVALAAGCLESASGRLRQVQQAGLECAAWVGNDVAADARAAEWLTSLRRQLPGRELGTIPSLTPDRLAAAAAALDLPRVLHALAA